MTTAKNFPFVVEAKCQEGWDLTQILTAPKSQIYQWIDQVNLATPKDKIPMIVFKKNGSKEYVLFDYRIFEYSNSFGNLASLPYIEFSYNSQEYYIFLLENLLKISSYTFRDTEGSNNEQ